MKRLLGGAALVVIAVLVTATPAFAHAELESTSPESGANLPAGQPPDSVSMTFSEGVQLPENAVQLLNSDGQTVSGVGKAQHGDSDSVVTTALPALDDGTYVVDWHVVSVDSHPIDGAFTFNVGAATGNAKDVAGLVAGKNDHGVGIAFGLTRALAFASVLVLVGGIFFLRVCSSESGNDSGVRAMLWVSWVVAFVTSFVGIGMQAAYTSSQDITKFFDATAIGDVMDTKFGQAWLIRAGLLILVLPALRKLSTARSLFVNVIDATLAVFVARDVHLLRSRADRSLDPDRNRPGPGAPQRGGGVARWDRDPRDAPRAARRAPRHARGDGAVLADRRTRDHGHRGFGTVAGAAPDRRPQLGVRHDLRPVAAHEDRPRHPDRRGRERESPHREPLGATPSDPGRSGRDARRGRSRRHP